MEDLPISLKDLEWWSDINKKDPYLSAWSQAKKYIGEGKRVNAVWKVDGTISILVEQDEADIRDDSSDGKPSDLNEFLQEPFAKGMNWQKPILAELGSVEVVHHERDGKDTWSQFTTKHGPCYEWIVLKTGWVVGHRQSGREHWYYPIKIKSMRLLSRFMGPNV